MLVHGHAPSILTTSTIIPIAKGTNLNKSDSANYRAISLSSIICKIIDLIVINRYSDCLVTSPNQFGFKPKGSTAVCILVYLVSSFIYLFIYLLTNTCSK